MKDINTFTEHKNELHIWMGTNYKTTVELKYMCITLEETELALKANKSLINTVQTHVCSTEWLTKGYRIFVHMIDGKVVEMKLGHIDGNPKDIRVEHNLERMLLAGSFGKSTVD